MKLRNNKFIFWLIGFGSGMILSGIVGAVCSLNINEYKTAVSNINQENKVDKGMGSIAQKSEQLQQSPQTHSKAEIAESLPVDTPVAKKQQLKEQMLQTPVPSKETDTLSENTIEIDIPSYFTAQQIGELLEEKKIIDDSGKFIAYVREQKKTTKLRAGKYTVPLNSSYEEVLKCLV